MHMTAARSILPASATIPPATSTEPMANLIEQTLRIIGNIDSTFRVLGRTYIRNDGLACDFSCTGIEFTALCEGEIYLTVYATSQAYLTVCIDGERSENRISINPAIPFVRIAHGLEYGEHTIMIINQTQFPMATMVMHEVRLTGWFREKPADRKLFIEFYGDSTLHGSNVFLGGTSAQTSDATSAFGWIAAQRLNADCSLIGHGGLGLVKSNISYSMLDLYNLCGSIKLDNVPQYDFSRVPNAVVIKLGTNDYVNGGLSATPEIYAEGIVKFIDIIRQKYGAAVPIVWIYGHRDDALDFWPTTKATLDTIKDAGDGNIHYCKVSVAYVPKNQGGDNWHPNVKMSKIMGGEVANFLEKLLK
jgi:hypothetical protein